MATTVLEYKSPEEKPPRPQNGLANASAACGVVLLLLLYLYPLSDGAIPTACVAFVWPAASIAAVAFGIGGMRAARRMHGIGRKLSQLGVVAGVVGMIVVGLALAATLGVPKSYERWNRDGCATNLTQIHAALQSYSQSHAGKIPDGLDQLLNEIDASAFVCPSSPDEKAPGATTREVGANVRRAQHCSYVYVGGGMTWPASAAAIIAFEDLENHEGEGMHILFGDGVVKWYSAEEAEYLLRSIRTPTTAPLQ
jgi:hypothetical protein